MHKITLSIDKNNLKTVCAILEILKDGLVFKIEIDGESKLNKKRLNRAKNA